MRKGRAGDQGVWMDCDCNERTGQSLSQKLPKHWVKNRLGHDEKQASEMVRAGVYKWGDSQRAW